MAEIVDGTTHPWSERILGPMVSLRGDPADKAFAAPCEAALGHGLPAVNRIARGQDRDCLGLGPDEWLIIEHGDDRSPLADRLDAALADCHHALVDVSGHRVGFRLTGESGRELLAAGCPLDVEAFLGEPDRCAQTLLGRTAVLIVRASAEPVFDILVRRSFGHYLAAWLDRAADSVDQVRA